MITEYRFQYSSIRSSDNNIVRMKSFGAIADVLGTFEYEREYEVGTRTSNFIAGHSLFEEQKVYVKLTQTRNRGIGTSYGHEFDIIVSSTDSELAKSTAERLNETLSERLQIDRKEMAA